MHDLIVRTELDLPTNAQAAWSVFGEGFASWADWAPGIERSTLEGPLVQGVVRINETSTLGTVRQVLVSFDPDRRTLAYDMLPSLPPPFTRIHNTWTIEVTGPSSSRLVGEAQFGLADGAEAMRDKIAGKMGRSLDVFATSLRDRLLA